MNGYNGLLFTEPVEEEKGYIYYNGTPIIEFGPKCNWRDCLYLKISGLEVKELPYPIGSLYVTPKDSPEPNELLGFGKWEIIAKEPYYYWKRVA